MGINTPVWFCKIRIRDMPQTVSKIDGRIFCEEEIKATPDGSGKDKAIGLVSCNYGDVMWSSTY